MAIAAFSTDSCPHCQSLPSSGLLPSNSLHRLFFAGSDATSIVDDSFSIVSISWANHGESWLYSAVSSTHRLRCLAAFRPQVDLAAKTAKNAAAVVVCAVSRLFATIPGATSLMAIGAVAVSYYR